MPLNIDKDRLLEIMDEALTLLENKEQLVDVHLAPFEYDLEKHRFICPKCGSSRFHKLPYNTIDHKTLSGSSGFNWVCLDCDYKYTEIIVQS